MKHFKNLMKGLLVVTLSIMLAFTTLVANTNEVNASGEYSLEVFYGLGRPYGTTNINSAIFTGDGAMLNNNTGYSLKGYRDTAYTNGPSSGNTNRYDQAPQGSIASVDFYYGGSKLTANSIVSSSTHCIKTNFYLDSNGNLGKTADGNVSWPSGSTKIVGFAAAKSGDSNAMASRWYNIPGAIDVVIHYSSGEHTITVNNIEDASFDNSLGEKYDLYYTTKANNSTSTIVSADYTNSSGIAQEINLLDENPLGSVTVTVGSSVATCNDLTGVQYLSSSYEFSSEHASSDILALDFENNLIVYYAVTTNINIAFNYATTVTHNVKFMVGEDEYDSQIVYDGYTAAKPVDPTVPEGYSLFAGWYLNDEEYNFAGSVYDDLVIEAKFYANTFTFKNVTAVHASTWVERAGGVGFEEVEGDYVAYAGEKIVNEVEVDNDESGVKIRFDFNNYAGAIQGAVVKFGEVEAEIPAEWFSVKTERFLDSEGNWSDELADPENVTYILKFAPDQGHPNYSFFRVWNMPEDIEVEVELAKRSVTFVNFGHKYVAKSGTYLSTPYVSADGWGVTGGTLYASPKAAIDEFDVGENANKGNHHQAVAVTNGDYSNTTGVAATILTQIEDLKTIIFKFGDHDAIELEVNGDAIKGKTFYINKDYELEERTEYVADDIFKLAVNTTTTNQINVRFYKIVENVTIEAKYFVEHTIRILNFGNEGHNYIGTGAYSTNTSGNYVGVRCWDPYGTGSGNNKRNGGTIDYAAGVATIYGDYSSTSGIGAAILVHEDYEKHNKVVITYGDLKTEFPLDNVNGVNQYWEPNGVRVLQFVQNKNVEYYNVRFFNVTGDITIESMLDVSASLTLNADGTLTENLFAELPDMEGEFVATIDGEEVELTLVDAETNRYTLSTPAKAPAELNQTFDIVITNGEKEIYSSTTSMKDYLMLLKDDESLGYFVQAMLNYASYCQVYFGVNADDLANKELSTDEQYIGFDDVDTPIQMIEDDHGTRQVIGETEGINFQGCTMNLKAATSLNVYFRLEDGSDIADYEFIDEENNVLEPTLSLANSSYYYVTFSNVAAPDLGKEHTVTATKQGAGSLNVSVSCITQAREYLVNHKDGVETADINLVNVMMALYNYYYEAAYALAAE